MSVHGESISVPLSLYRVCECPGGGHRYEVHHRPRRSDSAVDGALQRSVQPMYLCVIQPCLVYAPIITFHALEFLFVCWLSFDFIFLCVYLWLEWLQPMNTSIGLTPLTSPSGVFICEHLSESVCGRGDKCSATQVYFTLAAVVTGYNIVGMGITMII